MIRVGGIRFDGAQVAGGVGRSSSFVEDGTMRGRLEKDSR